VRKVLDAAGTIGDPFVPDSSQGPCERWHRTLREGIQSLIATFGFPLKWLCFLPLYVQYAYNRTATFRGSSPIFATTGEIPDASFMPGDPIVWGRKRKNKTARPRGLFGVFAYGLTQSECMVFEWCTVRFR